jgi:hypothetical protein
MFGMQLGSDLQTFVESIDPVKHFQTLVTLSSGNFIASKSKRKERKKVVRMALIAAANLQGTGYTPKDDCCLKMTHPEEFKPEESGLGIVIFRENHIMNDQALNCIVGGGQMLRCRVFGVVAGVLAF